MLPFDDEIDRPPFDVDSETGPEVDEIETPVEPETVAVLEVELAMMLFDDNVNPVAPLTAIV